MEGKWRNVDKGVSKCSFLWISIARQSLRKNAVGYLAVIETFITAAAQRSPRYQTLIKKKDFRGRGCAMFFSAIASLIDFYLMLIGEYKHTIDEKKRLAIPAKVRKELGRGAVLTRGLDNCLALYPLKEWEKLADKLSKLPTGQVEGRGVARVILSGAVEVDFDSLGRILIPDYLKQYASIVKNVVVAGVFNHMEIWDQAKWDSYKQKTEKEVGDMASKLSEIGF